MDRSLTSVRNKSVVGEITCLSSRVGLRIKIEIYSEEGLAQTTTLRNIIKVKALMNNMTLNKTKRSIIFFWVSSLVI